MSGRTGECTLCRKPIDGKAALSCSDCGSEIHLDCFPDHSRCPICEEPVEKTQPTTTQTPEKRQAKPLRKSPGCYLFCLIALACAAGLVMDTLFDAPSHGFKGEAIYRGISLSTIGGGTLALLGSCAVAGAIGFCYGAFIVGVIGGVTLIIFGLFSGARWAYLWKMIKGAALAGICLGILYAVVVSMFSGFSSAYSYFRPNQEIHGTQ